jgi:hypothetical protein
MVPFEDLSTLLYCLCGLAVLADDQVAFPVARHGPVRGLGRALADHHHVAEPSSVVTASAGTAPGPAGAQAAGQLAAQLTATLHIQRLVDGLVAHPHHGIARELDAQPSGDLPGDHHCSSQAVTWAAS